MLGYVYVVTTNRYKPKSIFKIGFTTNLPKRLKSFNSTRMDDDLFYCVKHWRTIHYSKMEAFLHAHLKQYRKKNEFFNVNLSLIEKGAKLFAETNGPQFFHEDVVLVNAELYDVQYISASNMFIFSGTSRIRYADDLHMRSVISDWLSCVDVYNLVRFTSTDVIDRLVMILKQACISKQERFEKDEIDISSYLRRLVLD
jgi:hypothetical protein